MSNLSCYFQKMLRIFGRKKRSIYIYKANALLLNRIFSISARSSLTAVQYSVLMIEGGGERRNSPSKSRFSKCFGFGILETRFNHHIQYHSELLWDGRGRPWYWKLAGEILIYNQQSTR